MCYLENDDSVELTDLWRVVDVVHGDHHILPGLQAVTARTDVRDNGSADEHLAGGGAAVREEDERDRSRGNREGPSEQAVRCPASLTTWSTYTTGSCSTGRINHLHSTLPCSVSFLASVSFWRVRVQPHGLVGASWLALVQQVQRRSPLAFIFNR